MTNKIIFGRGEVPIVARSFHCSSTQTPMLINCSHTGITLSSGLNYQSGTAAGVICQGNTSAPTECEHGDIRLVGGQTSPEGRVEICVRGYWATPCASYWSITATKITCKVLGFPSNGELTPALVIVVKFH